MSADQSPDHVTESASHRNGCAKNCHDPAARFDWKNIGQDCRRGRAVAAFADAYKDAGGDQKRKRRRKSGGASCQAPQNHSGTDDHPARKPIGKKTKQRRAKHISNEERRAEHSGLRHRIHIVGSEKTRANVRLNSCQNLAIHVVKQIDRKQKKQGTARAAHWFRRFFHRQLPIADVLALIVNHKPMPSMPAAERTLYFFGRLFSARFYRVTALGTNNLPQGGFLLLPTHLGGIDATVLQLACPRPIRYIIDQEFYHKPMLHWFLQLVRCIPIDTRHSHSAIRAAAKEIA